MKEGRYALFPDAVTLRGQKHLKTLMQVKKEGFRAVMLYIIQRSDVKIFAPARLIDPDYAITLKRAARAGVEIIPLQVKVTPKKIEPLGILPFEL
jgi:sugar fermentation stimulation protein A